MPMEWKDMEEVLRRIRDTGGETENMDELLRKVKADYDEREGELRRYRETYDGENRDRWVDRSDYDMVVRERDEARAGERSMREKYTDRFFRETEPAIKEQVSDTIEDGEKLTYDNLFRKRSVY